MFRDLPGSSHWCFPGVIRFPLGIAGKILVAASLVTLHDCREVQRLWQKGMTRPERTPWEQQFWPPGTFIFVRLDQNLVPACRDPAF